MWDFLGRQKQTSLLYIVFEWVVIETERKEIVFSRFLLTLGLP